MPRHCVVLGCRKLPKGGISTFSFPRDPELRQKWISAIQRENWHPTRFSAVCALHFRECDFQSKLKYKYSRLFDGAIPSIFSNTVYFPDLTETKEDSQILKEKFNTV